MLGKIGAALSVVALAVGGLAYYKTTKPQIVEASIPGEAIRAYLLDNPEVIMEAVAVYEDRKKAAEAAADGELVASTSEELFNDGFSLVIGNPDADLTVVEFSDYNCGYCKRAHGEVAKFMKADGNVKLIVKEFPILGPSSVTAARAALASRMQEDGLKYKAFNDALITFKGKHSEDSVMAAAEEVGLDVDQLREDMQSEEIGEMIKQTYALAQKLKITGTPAFIVGDQVVRGFVPAERLEGFAAVARETSG